VTPGGFEELLSALVRRAVREELGAVLDQVRDQVAAALRPEPKSYGVDQAAAMLGVSARTVRRLIDTGELPASRVGTRIVVPAAALDDHLHAAMHRGDGPPPSRDGSRWPPEHPKPADHPTTNATTAKRQRRAR
jgi:excisionase family DNA binding protein